MNKFFAMMVALVATVFASSAFAWNPPPSPAPQSWISDPGHMLTDAAHQRLDAKLKVINQSSANEIAALILPTLDGENVTDVGDYTFKAWGVGKKGLDNGVLVILGMKEHKSHITTGKGVEGDLPDLKCSDVLQAMRPYLRSNDIEGALGYAFDQSSTMIANHKAEAQAAAAKAKAASDQQTSTSTSNRSSCQVSAPGSDSGAVGWILGLLGLGLVGWLLMRRSSARSRERVDQIESETQALLDAQRARAARLNAEQEAHRLAEQARLQREAAIPPPAIVVEPPVFPAFPPPPIAPTFPVVPVVAAVTAATVINEAAQAEERRQHEAAARKRRLEEEEAANRRRREQAEEDDRRRRDESSSSSYSSSSSWDSGSSSSGGGWDSGGSGGFGGGDSGGGGASGDW